MGSRARWWPFAVLAIGAICALVIWRRAPAVVDRSPASEAIRAAEQHERGGVRAPVVGPPGAAPEAAPLPGSLDGTEADGAIEADAAGHLVIDLELRRLFDHFLAASGEEPIATMRARIIAALRARLPGTAVAEAIDLLDRYLAYREAARGLVAGGDDKAALDQVHELRAKLLPPAVVKAFFADEEAATYAAMERRDVLADRTLSEAERARRLAELEARIPAATREGRAAALAPLAEMQREDQLRAAGASEAAITASRTAAFGADGAARLAELDRAHAAWDARLARFRAAKAVIAADAALSEAERARRIAALLEASFTESERIRVEAIEGAR
jgi:lipase chaperone LimK